MAPKPSYVLIEPSTSDSAFKSRIGSAVLYYVLLTLRKLNLQSLRQLTPQRIRKETRKVVVYQNRRVVILHVLPLALPVAAAIAIIVINVNGLFVGDLSQTTIAALQFAAKALEVLMQASLATVVLAIVRAQVLGSEPLPLGGIVAPYRTNDISFLFSLELWGCITSRRMTNLRMMFTWILLVPLIVIMAALLGPSSAVLLIPRLMNHQTSKILFLMDPTETVFPQDTSGLVSESFANKVTLGRAFFYTSRYANVSVSIPSIDDIYDRQLSEYTYIQSPIGTETRTMSIPPKLLGYISAAVYPVIASYPPGFLSFDTRQPVVEQKCGPWDRLGVSKVQDTSCSVSLEYLKPNSTYNGTDDHFAVLTVPWPPSDDYLSGNTTYLWQKGCSNDLVYLATASWIEHLNGSTILLESTVCNVTASWRNARMNYNGNETSPYVSSDLALDTLESNLPIQLSPSWMKQGSSEALENIKGDISDSDFNLFKAALLVLFGLSALPSYTSNYSFIENLPNFLSLFHSPDCTEYYNGVSSPSQCKTLASFYSQPPHGYDTVMAFTTTNWTSLNTLTQIDLRYIASGHGFNRNAVPVKLSLAVVFIYVVISLCHIAYCFVTGLSATSWDSTTELLMLALNSHRPRHLEATSSGVETLATFREPVNVRANDQDTAEIVFTNDNDMKGVTYRKIEPNSKY